MNFSTWRLDVIAHVIEVDIFVYHVLCIDYLGIVTSCDFHLSVYMTICSLRPLVWNSLTRWSNLLFELDGARVSSAMLLGPSRHTTGQSPWESRGPRHWTLCWVRIEVVKPHPGMIKPRLEDVDQSHEDEVEEIDMRSVKHQQFSRMQKIKHQTVQQDATKSNVKQANDHET